MKWEFARFEGARLVNDAGRIVGRAMKDGGRELETWLAYAAVGYEMRLLGSFVSIASAQRAVELALGVTSECEHAGA